MLRYLYRDARCGYVSKKEEQAMRRILAVLLFSAVTLAFTSIVEAATIERFNPALLTGSDLVYHFMVHVAIRNDSLLQVRDPATRTWRFSGDAITPQEMIRRFQERNPQAKIVGVDLDPSGSHIRWFHIYYILNLAQR